MRRYFETADGDSLLNRMLYADTKTYLQELLMKQDQMSMAASIESRVPFLDHKLVEYTARLPDEMKLRHKWTTKYILREHENLCPRRFCRARKWDSQCPSAHGFAAHSVR
jgi:asparagine synthase (glutamine-hydrolysing)